MGAVTPIGGNQTTVDRSDHEMDEDEQKITEKVFHGLAKVHYSHSEAVRTIELIKTALIMVLDTLKAEMLEEIQK